jgi:hypothetical protein
LRCQGFFQNDAYLLHFDRRSARGDEALTGGFGCGHGQQVRARHAAHGHDRDPQIGITGNCPVDDSPDDLDGPGDILAHHRPEHRDGIDRGEFHRTTLGGAHHRDE